MTDKKLTLSVVVGAATAQFKGAMKEASAAIGDMKDKASKAASEISDSFKGAALAATAAGAAITGALVGAAASANKVDASLNKLRLMLDGRAEPTQIKEIETAIQQLSREFSTELIPTVEAAATALGDIAPEDLIGFMQTAAETSKVSGQDINAVIKTLTDTMDAFGLEAKDATEIADAFYAVQRRDGPNIAEAGELIGKVGPILARLGVSYKDLAAGMGAMAAAGVPARQIVGALNQVIEIAAKPSDEARAAMNALGVQFDESAIRSKGFTRALSDVLARIDRVNKSGGKIDIQTKDGVESVTALDAALRIFGPSANAMMVLAKDGAGGFNQSLKDIQASSGEVSRGMAIISESSSDTWTRATAAVGGFVNAIGKGVLDKFQPLIDAFGKFAESVTSFMEENPQVVGWIVSVTSALAAFLLAIGGAAGVVALLSGAISALATVGAPVIVAFSVVALPIIAAIGAAIALLSAGWNQLVYWFKTYGPEIKQAFVDAFGPAADAIASVSDEIQTNLMGIVGKFLAWVTAHLPEIKAFIKSAGEYVTKTLIPAVGEAISWLMDKAGLVFDFFVRNWPEMAKTAAAGWEVIKTAALVLWEVFGLVYDVARNLFEQFVGTNQEEVAKSFARFEAGVRAVYTVFSFLLDIVLGTVKAVRDLVAAIESGSFKDFFGALGKLAGGNIFDAAKNLPKFAGGVSNFGGGFAIVGEQGPELVNLPRGSDVIPNSQLVPALAGNGGRGGHTFNLYVRDNETAESVAQRIGQFLDNMRG